MTEIVSSDDVACRVVRVSGEEGVAGLDAAALLHEPAVLVVDDWPWPTPLESVRAFREARERAYDTAFWASRPAGLDAALAPFYAAMSALFGRLYGVAYPKVAQENKSWRPAVSRGEPMHFDTRYDAGEILVTAFLNASDTPREYGVSHTLPWLCRHAAAEVRAVCSRPYTPASVPLDLRTACERDRGPLRPAAPRHLIKFAPGSVWFFDPKRVSHELRYGDCAVCMSWSVPAANAAFLPEKSLARL